MNFLLYKKNIFLFFLSILFLLEGCGGSGTTAARIYKDTFSGNDQVECPDIKLIKELGQEIAEDSRWCGEFRQQGLIAALELVKNNESKQPFPSENRVGYKVYLEALKRGVFLRPLGDVIYFIPPLVINKEEITTMMNTARECIEVVLD